MLGWAGRTTTSLERSPAPAIRPSHFEATKEPNEASKASIILDIMLSQKDSVGPCDDLCVLKSAKSTRKNLKILK